MACRESAVASVLMSVVPVSLMVMNHVESRADILRAAVSGWGVL